MASCKDVFAYVYRDPVSLDLVRKASKSIRVFRKSSGSGIMRAALCTLTRAKDGASHSGPFNPEERVPSYT
jgi:hypothetical protein